MIKNKYEFVFVVLVYKNEKDLKDFVISVKEKYNNYKILVVNSFYDQKSYNLIKNESQKLDCDFISIENKGYGYGNNKGVEYCLMNYEFDFLIISNPDVIVEKNKHVYSKKYLTAPMIKTLKGKKQNPYWFVKNSICEFLIYYGYKHDIRLITLIGIIINKLLRELFLLVFKIINRRNVFIFAAHGSYICFPKVIIEKIMPIYDENMFLFSEEAYLAHKLKKMNIKIELTKEVTILHKEDGSVRLSNIGVTSEERKSIIYYYENYIQNGVYK